MLTLDQLINTGKYNRNRTKDGYSIQ